MLKTKIEEVAYLLQSFAPYIPAEKFEEVVAEMIEVLGLDPEAASGSTAVKPPAPPSIPPVVNVCPSEEPRDG